MEIDYFKLFTFRRFTNALKIISSYQLSRIFRKPIVWGYPLSFSIEPTNRCNLECPECPSGLGKLTRPLGSLSFNMFKKWVDQIKNETFYLQLFFQGEPFINKELNQMLEYARNQKIYTSISTNGLLLNDKNIDLVLQNPPDKLIFSIDGLDEQTYRNYRVGGSFKIADESLKNLLIKKRNQNLSKPFVELQFIVMKQNEHQINDLKKYARELGIDKLTLKTMQVSSYQNAINFLPKNKKYSRYTIENSSVKLKKKLANRCFAIWRTSVLTWDGNIVPCCFDKDANHKLGNINEQHFKEIWKNKNYYNFRKAILKNRKAIPICTNCTEGLSLNLLDN